MALSFPLGTAAFADNLSIESVSFYRAEFVESSGTAGGDLLVAEIAAPKWMAEITTTPLSHQCAARIQGLIEALGPFGQFYLYDPRKAYPAYDPTGAKLGSATPKISSIGSNNRSLRISGLPPGYVITAGDFMSYTFGSNPVRWALIRAVETVTASGVGLTPFFDVSTPLRAGTVGNLNIRLRKPVAKMQMMPGSFQAGAGRPRFRATGSMTFQAIEAP